MDKQPTGRQLQAHRYTWGDCVSAGEEKQTIQIQHSQVNTAFRILNTCVKMAWQSAWIEIPFDISRNVITPLISNCM
jgi:hypothetical protein